MKLGRKQEIFSWHFAELILYAREQRHEARIMEVERSKSQAEWNATHCRVLLRSKRSPRGKVRCEQRITDGIHHRPDGHKFRRIGIKMSLHRLRLAGDLGLTLDGVFLEDNASYGFLGEKWESFSGIYYGAELKFCWGGRFRNPDGGHFSIAHGGRK